MNELLQHWPELTKVLNSVGGLVLFIIAVWGLILQILSYRLQQTASTKSGTSLSAEKTNQTAKIVFNLEKQVAKKEAQLKLFKKLKYPKQRIYKSSKELKRLKKGLETYRKILT